MAYYFIIDKIIINIYNKTKKILENLVYYVYNLLQLSVKVN